MRMAKRLLTMSVLLLLCVGIMAVSAYAADSGTCGENLTWSLDSAGTLTISGAGEMPSFAEEAAPWQGNGVKSVVIGYGVENVGAYAFADCAALTQATLSDTVFRIDPYAFYQCGKLASITIPNSVYYVGSSAFGGCPSLTDVYYSGSAMDWKNLAKTTNTRLVSANVHYNWGTPAMLSTPVASVASESNGVRVAWQPIDGAELYQVLLRTSFSEDWVCIGYTKDTNFEYRDTRHGKTYYFSVRCVNTDKETYTSAFNMRGWGVTFYPTPTVTKMENTADGIRLTWEPIDGVYRYRVIRLEGTTRISEGVVNGNSFLYADAVSGESYTFTIQGLSGDSHDSFGSTNRTGWTQTYIAEPVLKRLENTAEGIRLTWDAVPGAERYRVYVRSNSRWICAGHTTGTNFVYTEAECGQSYVFTVRCVNQANNVFTSSYNPTGWWYSYYDQPAITGFQNTAEGIRINWGKVKGAAGYRVFAKTSKGWLCIGYTKDTSFLWTAAKSGLTYTFTIRCVNTANTKFTSSYNATGWRQKYVAQPAVTKLTNSTGGINITWGAVSGAERYRVYVKTDSGWSCIGHTTGNSFTWTGAKVGVTYTFTVRCVNAANYAFTSSYNTSGWSIKRT